MQIATAIKILQKEAEFLGMPLLETLEFIKANPLAQPRETMIAFNVFMGEGQKLFATA